VFEKFKNEKDVFVVAEAVKCIQQFILFAPKYVDTPNLIPFLQSQLSGQGTNQVRFMRKAAITCIYQLTQRDPGIVLHTVVNSQLEEQLFAMLDIEMDLAVIEEIKDILVRLLTYTAPQSPSRWIDLCKTILSKGGATSSSQEAAAQAVTTADDDDDEDENDVGVKPKGPEKSKKAPEIVKQEKKVILLPRWRTQTFALNCLRKVINVVLATGKGGHCNLQLARELKECEENHDYLVFRLGDLVRLAFNSATFYVYEMRLEGLYFLKEVLEKFGGVEDPDFTGHALLEQYQVTIFETRHYVFCF
jgi:HEAT repeat-containing protein 5